MTREQIQAVMDKVTALNAYGIGTYWEMWQKPRDERLAWRARERESLLLSSAECEKVCEWLEGIVKRKTVNEKVTSYTLKHLVEQEMGGYVCNGAFIAAAIHCGFTYKTYPGSPNVCFGISHRSIAPHWTRRPIEGWHLRKRVR